jgi:hypothetical protein
MQEAGLRVAAVIDSRTGVEKKGDYRLIEGGQVVTTKGRHGLRQITVATADGPRISSPTASPCRGAGTPRCT